jgi:hypothetical protein
VFKVPAVTPDRLHEPHRTAVARISAEPGQTILFPEDTTQMIWTGNMPVQGLGPVGAGQDHEQGFLLHSTIAVRWTPPSEEQTTRPPVEILGLADQIYRVRTSRPEGEDKKDSQARKTVPGNPRCGSRPEPTWARRRRECAGNGFATAKRISMNS